MDREMGSYDTALICENGHVVNEYSMSFPAGNSGFCKDCGAKTINTCPDCNRPIRGDYTDKMFSVLGYSWPAPKNCHQCGTPFPWTVQKLEAARELTELLDELDYDEKETLIKDLEKVAKESPKSEIAAHRIKKYLAKPGKEGGEMLKKIVIDIASEAIKKVIFLGGVSQ